MILVLAVAAIGAAPLAAQRGPDRIIIVRHGEKPGDSHNPHLSPAGVRRSHDLVTFITTTPAIRDGGLPAAIYATQTTHDADGQRTQETVAPLAQKLGLSVRTPFHGSEPVQLARAILKDKSLAGKTVLICWNHEELPQLEAALGARPLSRKWKSSNFDEVDVITYHKGRATLRMTRYGAP